MKTSIAVLSIFGILASCSSPSGEKKEEVRSAADLVAQIKRQQHPDSLKNAATNISYTKALDEYIRTYPEDKNYEALLFQAATHANSQRNMAQAAHYYARFAEHFEKSDSDVEATFAAGFIYHNELHELDSAKKYFHMVITDYPTYPQKEWAEAELESLGKPAEEMLDNIMKKKEEREKKNPDLQ